MKQYDLNFLRVDQQHHGERAKQNHEGGHHEIAHMELVQEALSQRQRHKACAHYGILVSRPKKIELARSVTSGRCVSRYGMKKP